MANDCASVHVSNGLKLAPKWAYQGTVLPELPGVQVVQTDMVACRRGFARRWSQLRNDGSSDDNRDDTGPLNYFPYRPKMHVSCLVSDPARSWQCERLLFRPRSSAISEVIHDLPHQTRQIVRRNV